MGTLLDYFCFISVFVCLSLQSCNNNYDDVIDVDKEYFTPVVRNCSVGLTVTFSDGQPSNTCHNFFQPFTPSFYLTDWKPTVTNPYFTLTFEDWVTVSSLRLIDTFTASFDSYQLDVVTFVTLVRNAAKQRFTWSKAGLVENRTLYYHVLHFQTVTTKELTIEFNTQENKVWVAYFEVNRVEEHLGRDLLNLSANGNVSCSSNEKDCYKTFDTGYLDIFQSSWKAGPGDHVPSIRVELEQTYQLYLARVFLSSFQCTNVLMNVTVSCGGQRWIFGRKTYTTSNLSFVVFPMYSLETDTFSIEFDCNRDNGLQGSIRVVELEFYGVPTSVLTSTSTAATSLSTAHTTSADPTTDTLPPAAQSIGGNLKVTSEEYTAELSDYSSELYQLKRDFYQQILFESYFHVINSTSRIYNLTFQSGSIDTSYVADTLEQVTLSDALKRNLTDSIVNTFKRNNITVDPTSIDFTDLFSTTTVIPTKSSSENEILAGALGAVATLLVISLVIAGVTVRMCVKSQRQREATRESEVNNTNPSFQFPMMSSSQTSSSYSYPAFFSSSVRNQPVSMNRRLPLQSDAMFDFPAPFQRTPSSGRERQRGEDQNQSYGYHDNHGDRQYQYSMRQNSLDYVERTDKTSLTGYTPRRTEVPDQRPSQIIFDRAQEDEAYYSSEINYQFDGLHRNNSISLHRNRGYNDSDSESESHSQHTSHRRSKTFQRSVHTSDHQLYEGSGYQSPEHAHYHRDSLRVQDRRLQRNVSHDSDRTNHGHLQASNHGYSNEGFDLDALRPYYLAENNKQRGFFGRLSKKLSAPRIRQSGQNVHRQEPVYEQTHKSSHA